RQSVRRPDETRPAPHPPARPHTAPPTRRNPAAMPAARAWASTLAMRPAAVATAPAHTNNRQTHALASAAMQPSVRHARAPPAGAEFRPHGDDPARHARPGAANGESPRPAGTHSSDAAPPSRA